MPDSTRVRGTIKRTGGGHLVAEVEHHVAREVRDGGLIRVGEGEAEYKVVSRGDRFRRGPYAFQYLYLEEVEDVEARFFRAHTSTLRGITWQADDSVPALVESGLIRPGQRLHEGMLFEANPSGPEAAVYFRWNQVWIKVAGRPSLEAALDERRAALAREAEAEAAPDRTPRGIALEAGRRVPPGTRKEDFLPFVRAALQHFDARQSEALNADDTAASFAIAGEQFQYHADFERLTGRHYESARDAIGWAEIEALPVPEAGGPAAPAGPVEYECLECGFTTTNPRLIDAGGMGCVRCNH